MVARYARALSGELAVEEFRRSGGLSDSHPATSRQLQPLRVGWLLQTQAARGSHVTILPTYVDNFKALRRSASVTRRIGCESRPDTKVAGGGR